MKRTAHELLDILASRSVRASVIAAENWRKSRLVIAGRSSSIADLRNDLMRLKVELLAVLLVCECRDCKKRMRQATLPIASGYRAS